MAVRLSGLASGLDTESIITELMSAQSLKKTKIENKLTKLEWKEEKWAELNTKIYSLYTSELSKLKTQSSYLTKSVTASSTSSATFSASTKVPTGSHTVKVNSVASSQYITGSKIDSSSVTSSSTLSKLGYTSDSGSTVLSIKTNSMDEAATLTVTSSTKISEITSWAKNNGVTLSYDETNQRFFVSASSSGTDGAFELTASYADSDGNATDTESNVLDLMGIGQITSDGTTYSSSLNSDDSTAVNIIQASNAEIVYNGVTYESSTNSFTINGLTINTVEASDTTINLTVASNSSAVYDMVKSFVSAYNTLLEEMNTLYNADSASSYEVLTDDERDSMSDSQIEKWETKIQDSLLRKDSTLKSIISSFKSIASQKVDVNGTTYSLSSFGITTTDYTEAGQLHIYGDSDDSTVSDYTDKLLAAIESDPDTVMTVLTTIGTSLYSDLSTKMSSSSISSALTLYNDKQITSMKSKYEDEISKWEDRLATLEDRYYSKFTAMETALSKLNAQTSYIASLFGS